jgi:urease accessory protein
VLLDWLTSGRHATGERWAFDAYCTRTTVRCQRRLVLYDAVSLQAADGDLRARMGRFNVICALVIIGPPLGEWASLATRTVAALPVDTRADAIVSASPLGDAGTLVRIAGVTFESVSRAVRSHLQFVRSLIGDDPSARRW